MTIAAPGQRVRLVTLGSMRRETCPIASPAEPLSGYHGAPTMIMRALDLELTWQWSYRARGQIVAVTAIGS
jgi:hypothetical protein